MPALLAVWCPYYAHFEAVAILLTFSRHFFAYTRTGQSSRQNHAATITPVAPNTPLGLTIFLLETLYKTHAGVRNWQNR